MGSITRGKALRGDMALYDGKTKTATRPDASGGTTSGLVVDNTVDVLQKFGNGTTQTDAAIAAAVAHIGSSAATLVFAPGTWTISANVTIPANMTCIVPAGCIFSPDTSKTITFSGLVKVEYPTSWTSGAGTVTVSVTGSHFGVYFRTAAEVTASATVVNYNYPPGNLKRYTTNGGDGTDISAAFETMLACGEKYCFVPAPTTTWGIATQIDWVSGVSVYCGLGTSFTSSRASGEWAFVFDGVPYASGASFEGFLLNITNAGARGIQIWESRDVHIDRFEILGPSGIGGYGIEINGGDDASPTWGAAHNSVTRGRIYRMAAGIRMYTDNTTTPASNTAFCNRNYVAAIQAQTCTEGLFMDRANTNQIHMSLQANTEGADIQQYAKNNTLNLIPENNTRPIVLSTSADDNLFMGTVQPTDFVDSGGVQVNPHVTTCIVSSNNMQLPRELVLPTGGGLRLSNPYDSGPMRIRANDTYDQNLIIASHDAADTNFDIFGAMYHATAPSARVYENLLCSKEVEIDGALNHDGTTAGFMGATPVVQAAHVTHPTGGATIDAEARTAINAVIVILENLGFMST
jgi:hypothetical protein